MNEPKYKIGDKVWTLNDSKIHPKVIEREIYGVLALGYKEKIKQYKYFLELKEDTSTNYWWQLEEGLFPTKEALIQSL